MITSIVLAGGRGRRLGRDKATELLGGESLLHRVVNRLSPLGLVLVVTAGEQTLRLPPGVETVIDVYPGKGPLGGVYSGLKAAATPYALAVGCDMPFLNIALLRYLAKQASGYDVVIPRLGGRPEPLHAVYSRDCLPAMEALIKQDKLSLHGLLSQLRVRYVEEQDIDTFDPRHWSFFNINTPDDLVKARLMLAEQGELLAW